MPTTKSRSLFGWAGSKARMMPRLIPLMPDHHRYVSLFGGSGADIIHKPHSRVEVFNDINKDVVNVFSVLRSDTQRRKLIAQLELTPYSRFQFVECLALLRTDENDPVKRAWAFIYCTIPRCNNVDPGICSDCSFGVPKKDGLRHGWNNFADRIKFVGQRFCDVIVENLSWQRVIDKYDAPNAFIYADPPYVRSTRKSECYQHEMTDEQHIDLLTTLSKVKARVMLSGYENPLYARLLASWRREEWTVRCSMSSAAKKPARTEVIWLNYGKDGKRLAG